jgi:tRNA(Ile)-lysidine synthetase-like protein
MKRFTGHTEEWGTFTDVKVWPEIANPRKYAGQKVIIGTVTDGYNPLEEQFGKTRLLLEQLTGTGRCTAAHLQALLDLCRGDAPSAQYALPGGITARRVYDKLELAHGEDTALLPTELSPAVYDGQPQTPDCFYLASDSRPIPRPRRTGDRLTLPGRPGRTVKKWMIDEKIPRHLRDTLPVLDCGGQVAGVVGLGPDVAFIPAVGQPCWLVRYIPNTERNELS